MSTKLRMPYDEVKEIMKNQIEQLKREKNAVILAHYYAPAQVQEIADYVGDSFYLAKIAKQTDADIIVFCGVQFMGESAKILNPHKIHSVANHFGGKNIFVPTDNHLIGIRSDIHHKHSLAHGQI